MGFSRRQFLPDVGKNLADSKIVDWVERMAINRNNRRFSELIKKMKGFGIWVALGFTLFLTLATPVFSQTSEIRGVWLTNVDSQVMFNRDSLKQALQELKTFNFNTLYPAVWNWGYTLYPSAIAESVIGHAVDPREPGLQDRDMLNEIVRKSHRRGIAVIPWFEFGFMTDAYTELARVRPDWITVRQDGTSLWQDGIYQRVWLNPFKPEVQQFILSLILEIVENYDIDGIQFDDHFGLPAEFGYDAYTVALYQQEHSGQSPSTNPQDEEWVRWRANKITTFMRQVFREIKARNEDVIVALSPNSYAFSYHRFLQDWLTWERQGLVEELLLQVYTDSPERFREELQRPEVQEARRHIPTGIGILTGLKDRPVPIRQVQEQVEIVRSSGFAGLSFFFYETLWNLTNEDAGARRSILQALFSTPASRSQL